MANLICITKKSAVTKKDMRLFRVVEMADTKKQEQEENNTIDIYENLEDWAELQAEMDETILWNL